MPLVLFVGIPSSGKTTCAKSLSIYLENKSKMNVLLINDESLKLDRNEAYKDSYEEKMTRYTIVKASTLSIRLLSSFFHFRGLFLSEVQRNISHQTIVICDSLNYIKGYRYELFCRARDCRTPICVIHIDTPKETAAKWNKVWNEEMYPLFSQNLSLC